MQATGSVTIIVLPIGEFDSEPVKHQFDEILSALDHPQTSLCVADPVSDKEGARQAVQVLSGKNPDLLLIVPLRGLSAQAIEAAAQISLVPCVVLPIQGRYALPSSALAVGALQAAKLPVELLYGPADHPEFIQRLGHLQRAAEAYVRIKRSRIGVIGGLFPNLVSCRYDQQIVKSRLGVSLIPISFNEIRDTAQLVSHGSADREQLREEMTTSYMVSRTDAAALGPGLDLHLTLKHVAQEKEIDGFATECWSGFPQELGLNPCLGFVDDAYALACEGDVMLCVSLLIVRNLAPGSAFVGDLYDLDLDGILTLTHCGAPASLASKKRDVLLAKSQLALERGFETMTCRPRVAQGPVTVFRFFGMECDRLHLASGELIECEQSPNLTVKVRINANRWDFLDQCLGNHYLVVAGDIRAELRLLCKWFGITIAET